MSKDKVTEVMLLTDFLVIIFGTCQPYYRVYIGIPLLLWMKERERNVWIDCMFAICFFDVLWRGNDLLESSLVLWAVVFISIVVSVYSWIRLRCRTNNR